MIRNKGGMGLERPKRCAKGRVALLDRFVEAIVGGSLLGDLPNALDGVEFGRVRRQAE